MTSRGYGRGSISLRSDGLWVGRIEVNVSPRKRKVFSSKDRERVEAMMDAWLAEHRPGRLEPKEPGSRTEHMLRAKAVATHTASEWRAKRDGAGGMCHYCKRPVAIGGCKDHMTPVSRGGSNGIDNVTLACWDCNAAKSDMTAEEFMDWAELTGFFSEPQRVTIKANGRNRRITPAMLAVMKMSREQRVRMLDGGRR